MNDEVEIAAAVDVFEVSLAPASAFRLCGSPDTSEIVTDQCLPGAAPTHRSRLGPGDSCRKLGVVVQRDFLVEIEIEMVQTHERAGRGERKTLLQ